MPPRPTARRRPESGPKSRMMQALHSSSSPASYTVVTQMEEQVSGLKVENTAAKEAIQSMLDDSQKVKGPQRQEEDIEQDMSAHMHKEIFKLIMVQGEQEERLDQVVRKEQEISSSRSETVSKMETLEQQLDELEEAGRSAEVKHEQSREVQETIAVLEQELAELTEKYQEGKGHLDKQLQAWNSEVLRLQKETLHIELQNRGEHIPPGPFELRWVDEHWWHLTRWVVLLCNMLAIFLAFTHRHVNFVSVECIFLLFYLFELGSNLAYFQHTFFMGTWRHVMWNVLDLVVVASSFTQVILEICQGGNSFKWMRLLFLMRLIRVMKFVHSTFMVDLKWVEGDLFQSFMLGVIGLNCLLMGVEMENEDWFLWTYFNNVFLLIYSVELWARLKLAGIANFFWGNSWRELFWNYLDFVIVFIATVCLWIAPMVSEVMFRLGYHHLPDGRLKQLMTVLRVVRLFRILRLAELVKSIPPLYILVIGIARALQGMGWVMLLTACVLYFCALLGVKFIGEGWMLPDNSEDIDAVRKTFDNIPDAVFNLFKAMNGDLSGVDPLLRAVTNSRWVMMAFMIIMNWAIFSILTAVVSDNMALVTQEHELKQRQEEEMKRQAERAGKMERIFQRIDADGNGSVDFQEFYSLLQDDASAKELSNSTGLPVADLMDLFDLISKRHGNDKTDTISHDEFMKLLNTECGQVTARSMMYIEKEMSQIEHLLERHGLQPSGVAAKLAEEETRQSMASQQSAR